VTIAVPSRTLAENSPRVTWVAIRSGLWETVRMEPITRKLCIPQKYAVYGMDLHSLRLRPAHSPPSTVRG
jgi:hypothetical protein